MSVQILEGWTDQEWDEEAQKHREATLFHTRLWAKICCRSFPQLRDRSVWIEVRTEFGSSRHLLPLLEWRRGAGLLTTTQSAFPHLYGGPLPVRGAGRQVILPEVLEFFGKSRGTLRLTSNPLSERPFDRLCTNRPESDAETEPRVPGWEATSTYTHLRTLPETEDEFWEGELPPKRRNDVRRITKKGVRIEESRNPEDASRLYELYRASFARWGGKPAFSHPEAFYRNLVGMGGESVRLSVARYEGKVIGGVFALRYGLSVQYLAGYFDPSAKSLRPNVLLQVDSLRKAIRDRFALYDFLPSGGNAAVERFKAGFGGQRIEVPVWIRRSLGHRLVARARGR